MKLKRILWVIVFVCSGVMRLWGQMGDTLPYFWVTGGVGAASVQNARWELSAGFSGNVSFKKQLLGMRVLRNEELVIFRTALKVNEVGIYYGHYFLGRDNNSYAALGAGLSIENYYSYGEQYYPPNSNLGTYHYLVENTIWGMALDAQAGANFGRFVGLGVHGFATVNTEKMIGGILLSVRLGYLGER